MDASTSTSLRGPAPTAYSYIRFSDAKQFRGDSLRRQLERSREYAERHGLKLDESTTIRDLGVSAFRGVHRQSGALGAFFEAVQNGKISSGSYLLVESFDRLSREKPMAAHEQFSKLINAGITIVTLIDEAVHSRAVYDKDWTTLIVSLAKMAQANEESAKKSDRLSAVWRDKQTKAMQGVIATGRCPGWLRKEGDAFVLIPERTAIVRRIYEEFVAGLGRGTIARRLNRDGVAPFGHGTGWHGGSVQKITNNAAVIGHYIPHTVKREVVDGPDGKPMTRETRIPVGDANKTYYPIAIPAEIFYRAQAVAADRSVVPGNAGGRKGTVVSNLFSGITACVACKRPMIYKDRGPRSTVVLRCSGEHIGNCSNEVRVPYKALETAVLDWVQELDLGEARSDQIISIEKRLSILIADQVRLDQIAQSLIREFEGSSRRVKDRVLQLEKEIDDIEIEINTSRRSLENLKGAVPASERKAQVAALRSRMAAAAGTELYVIRAALAQSLREIVKIMIVHDTGRVQIVLKGAEKQYAFTPLTSRIEDGYKVDAMRIVLRSDEEMGFEQQKLIDMHTSLMLAIEADE